MSGEEREANQGDPARRDEGSSDSEATAWPGPGELTDLAPLRATYDPRVLFAAATGTLARMHPPGAPYTGAIGAAQYEGGPLAARDRERCLIALLAAQKERMTLAVHIYWGLMEGLSIAEVAHTLLLTGIYAGTPAYANGLLVLEATRGQLAAAAAAGECGSAAVLGRLVAALR